MNFDNITTSVSSSINHNAGNMSKYFKDNILKFIKNIPIIFKDFVVNAQTILVSVIVLVILLAISFVGYKLYNNHSRPWNISQFLEISASNDKHTKNLDDLYYKNLALNLAHYIYDHDFSFIKDIIKGNESEQKKILSYINSQIFFHKYTSSYAELKKFELTYNVKSNINKNWGTKSIDGLNTFFYDILINRKFVHNAKKKYLIYDILQKNKKEFESNLDKVVQDNIYSYINANNYINNNPQNDYIINTYGKFIKVKTSNYSDKYLYDIFNIPNGLLKDILKPSTDNHDDIIVSKLKDLQKEYDNIASEKLELYIFRIMNGSTDTSDFENYKRFIKDYGISGNDLLDDLEKLSKVRNNKVDLTRQSLYNIERAVGAQKLKIIIYQDIIIYKHYISLLNNYSTIVNDTNAQKLLTSKYNWHLERLAYSKCASNDAVSENNVKYIFDEQKRNRFMKINSNILDLINYPMYKSEMSYGLFAVLYIYLSKTSIKEKLKLLADYYMSFSELYLAVDKIQEFELLKKKEIILTFIKNF